MKIISAIKYYLIICGILIHISFLAAILFALDYYALSPRQFLIKSAEKVGLDNTQIISVLEPAQRYEHHTLDGSFKTTHPRIILPELANWSGQEQSKFMAERFKSYRQKKISAPTPPCQSSNTLFNLISCWLATGNGNKAALAVERLMAMEPETPDAEAQYGNGWEMALAYDLLSPYRKFDNIQRLEVEKKIEEALIDYLRVLDEGSASLWHGRITLASNAWLCAIVLSDHQSSRKNLITRAQGHFLDTAQAIAMTEAWPGGYNYWVNSRAFTFVLAGAAYINGLENAQYTKPIINILKRIGLWTIYATRPDNRIEGYGDEGSRIDLKDETQRVIDLIASQTKNIPLASYSHYLSKLHGRESYYRDYRWGFHLFNDPNLLLDNNTQSLQDFENKIPNVELFGENFSNKFYIRSSWQPNATFISYSSGHKFSHHGHYDAGHFTLFKSTPLAVNSSTYGQFNGKNRLYYSIRTVAKNSLLIQRPGEKVQPNRFFTENVSDGGQRVTLPTGSAITSTTHWKENLYDNLYLAGAELDAYEKNPDFAYIKSNLTPAYNNVDYDDNDKGGKVERVSRELFYLFSKDVLLVRDQINTTDPNYRTKWLLHSVEKPLIEKEKILVGDKTNGILESHSKYSLIVNKNGYLAVQTLWPRNALTHTIGGPDYKFYVETDGDDSTLNGKNYSDGASSAAWFDNPQWRIEIFPSVQTKTTNFLISLSPSINKPAGLHISPINNNSMTELSALIEDTVIVFNKSTNPNLQLNIPGDVKNLYLIGYKRMPIKYSVDEGEISPTKDTGRIYKFDLTPTTTDKQINLSFR